MLRDVAKALYDFHMACPDEGSITLECCCTFQHALDKLAVKVKSLSAENSDLWHAAFSKAHARFVERFAAEASKWIQSTVKDKGPDGGWAYLNSCKSLPASLKSFSSVIAQASFLKELKVPETTTTDVSELTVRTKSLVTIKSLSSQSLQALFPEEVSKTQTFVEAVERNINKVITKLKDSAKPILQTLEKYRRGERKQMQDRRLTRLF